MTDTLEYLMIGMLAIIVIIICVLINRKRSANNCYNYLRLNKQETLGK